MSLAITFCRAQLGMDAPLVTVETHLANGLPSFSIVGLPEKAVQESRDRVRSALSNSGFTFPPRRITVNLAPADLPKQGSRFDLAIAIGVLIASGQLPSDAAVSYELIAELSLAGALRPVSGLLPSALAAQRTSHRLVVAEENAVEVGMLDMPQAFRGADLLAVAAHLADRQSLPRVEHTTFAEDIGDIPDLQDVAGQQQARRALEIAAAGRHHLLMMGPPGSGKSMLATRLPGILPVLDADAALEQAAIRSVAGQTIARSGWRHPPFRAPHHTASGVALVGGGSHPRPGEISLAHHGVLFLDELAEFDARVLDVLREPLETGQILISRAARQAAFPADFQLIAAMNPCKCGYANDPARACASCGPEQTARYQRRISGPLRDRIDLQIEVPALPHADILKGISHAAESSAEVRARVVLARQTQIERQGKVNAKLSQRELQHYCGLPQGGRELLTRAIDTLGLSARAFHRILRVARTIADIEQSPAITLPHLSEAIGYRRLDNTA